MKLPKRIYLAGHRIRERYRYLAGRAWLARVIRDLDDPTMKLYREELERRFFGLYGRRPRFYDGRLPWL